MLPLFAKGNCRQVLEMFITGQERRAVRLCSCEYDGIGGRQFVRPAGFGGRQRNFRVKRDHRTDLRKGDDLISLFFADFAHQPFREFQLHHGRDDPFGLLGKVLGYLLSGR